MLALKTFLPIVLAAVAAQAASVQKRANSGRGTFYEVGRAIGNCGERHNNGEMVVALNTAQYGSTSQVSGACGQQITVRHNGKSETATIVDSCPTCPNGALDLSPALFSRLTDGNMDLGVIQLSWTWGAGGNGGKNNGNRNQGNQRTAQPQAQAQSDDSDNQQESNQQESNDDESSAVPSNTAQKTTTGKPSWWKTIDTSACPDVEIPEGVNNVSIGPGDNAGADDLQGMCGKFVQIWNTANDKSTKAIVTSYQPDAEENSIYMSDAYLEVAEMNGENPTMFEEARWGFLN